LETCIMEFLEEKKEKYRETRGRGGYAGSLTEKVGKREGKSLREKNGVLKRNMRRTK